MKSSANCRVCWVCGAPLGSRPFARIRLWKRRHPLCKACSEATYGLLQHLAVAGEAVKSHGLFGGR